MYSTYMRTYIYIYVCVHVNIYVCVCVCACTYVCIYSHMYMFLTVYMHAFNGPDPMILCQLRQGHGQTRRRRPCPGHPPPPARLVARMVKPYTIAL